MNGKSRKFLKTLGSDDKKGKALWESLAPQKKDQVRRVFAMNPKFAGHGLPAILEAIRDYI